MSGSIAIPNFDTSIRNPGVFEGIDGSAANTATAVKRVLIVGQMTSTGTAKPGFAVIVAGAADTATYAGANSVLTAMVTRYVQQDPQAQVWILPLADDPNSVSAQGAFGFAGTATSGGTIAIYIGGVRFPVGVAVGDTAATIAENFENAVNLVSVPFGLIPNSAGDGLGITFAHGGLLGNDMPILVNIGGAAAGEVMPAGITITSTPMSGGQVNPDVLAPLDNLASLSFDCVVQPYSDTTSLNDFQAFFSDTNGRWSANNFLLGHAWGAYRGTFGACDTFGFARNDKHMTIFPVPPSMPDPIWTIVSDVAANCYESLRVNPNLPLQYIVTGLRPPANVADYWTTAQQNVFLYDGLSTFTVNDAGQVIIQRMVTTYQENAAGVPDNSFLDTETDYALMDLCRDWRTNMLSQFSRKILVVDGSILPGGSAQVTSQTVRAATISWYSNVCSQGRAQDPQGFARDIIAQNAGNGQVRTTLPFRLDNQLRQIAGAVNFSKP